MGGDEFLEESDLAAGRDERKPFKRLENGRRANRARRNDEIAPSKGIEAYRDSF